MKEIHSKKLRRFAATVNFEIEEKIEKIKEEAETQKQELLRETEDRVLQESFVRIQKAVKDIEYKYRRAASLQEYEHNIEVLKHRGVLIKMLFAFVEMKINGFTQSEEYGDFLVSQLKNEDLNGAVIKISEKDMKYSEALEKASGCKVETDTDIQLGGISLYYEEKSIIIDKTFDSEFEHQQQNFASNFRFSDN